MICLKTLSKIRLLALTENVKKKILIPQIYIFQQVFSEHTSTAVLRILPEVSLPFPKQTSKELSLKK